MFESPRPRIPTSLQAPKHGLRVSVFQACFSALDLTLGSVSTFDFGLYRVVEFRGLL